MGKDTKHSSKEKFTKRTFQFFVYVLNIRAHKFAKEELLQLKSCINPHTLIVGDFNIPFLPIDMSPRQKLKKEILELIDIIN